jgi:hypothetical protein
MLCGNVIISFLVIIWYFPIYLFTGLTFLWGTNILSD